MIRWQELNDGKGTIVFRAQDVCDALGVLDYALAMRRVEPDNVVIFDHPDTPAKGMRYACVTLSGAVTLSWSVLGHIDEGVPDRSVRVNKHLRKVVAEAQAA